jgi:ribosomal protein L11 methylase PrmA
LSADPASFRDPAGRVYLENGRVFRTVSDFAVADFEFARSNKTLRRLIDAGGVIETRDVAANDADAPRGQAARVVEHPRLPFISYPYEWSFSLLKAAALHHLDLQIALLGGGVALSDATAYNIQFIGPRPIFIDPLSFVPYQEGDYWKAHRQFCEQFLNPLLMHALVGVPHNDWFRGSLEGVPTLMLARMIAPHKRLSWRVLTQVVLPAQLQSGKNSLDAASATAARPLPKNAYLGMLTGLRDWIASMKPKGADKTLWADYAKNNSYDEAEFATKKGLVGAFVARAQPRLLWDLGCNTGEYSEVALANGASSVIGFDFDHGALEGAYARAVDRKLDFLPLFQDASNPSPGQGWSGEERASLMRRNSEAQALVALAFIHHIAIGRNVPLDRVVEFLVGLAPKGVVEFVPKEDAMVKRLLALRKDIFPDYTLDNFKALVARRARVVSDETVTGSGRTLVAYDRTSQ